MDSRKQREVTVRRRDLPPGEPDSAPPADLDDDTPVSSEGPGAREPWQAGPSYGRLGGPEDEQSAHGLAPAAEGGLEQTAGGPGSWLAAPRAGADEEPAPLLDAWLADRAHPALAALLRRPAVAHAILEQIDDADDRVWVRQTEAYPWRCICALRITAADGSVWAGTGWLAGPRTVVTAGHCVYLHRHGGWARAIEVVPGRDGEARPYGHSVATSLRSVAGWTQRRQQKANYGAIILPDDGALGNLLGHFGFASLADHELHGLRLNLAGYPSDRAPGTQWHHSRAIEAAPPRGLVYRADGAGGPSGAPLWHVRDGGRYVVGIHTHGDGEGGAAVRITPAVFRNLAAWQREGGGGRGPAD